MYKEIEEGDNNLYKLFPLNYATWCIVAPGKKYFWKEMFIKEKVYIIITERERGGDIAQPVK